MGAGWDWGTCPWDPHSSPRAHLLPGAGLPCPELDVAGYQLIPTYRDTNSLSAGEGQKAETREDLGIPSLTLSHLEWGLGVRTLQFPSRPPWIPGISQQQQALLGDW